MCWGELPLLTEHLAPELGLFVREKKPHKTAGIPGILIIFISIPRLLRNAAHHSVPRHAAHPIPGESHSSCGTNAGQVRSKIWSSARIETKRRHPSTRYPAQRTDRMVRRRRNTPVARSWRARVRLYWGRTDSQPSRLCPVPSPVPPAT